MISMTFIFYFSDQLTNVNDWLQIYFIYFRYLFISCLNLTMKDQSKNIIIYSYILAFLWPSTDEKYVHCVLLTWVICVYDAEDGLQVRVVFVHCLQDAGIRHLPGVWNYFLMFQSNRENRVSSEWKMFLKKTPLVWAQWWRALVSTAGSPPCRAGPCWWAGGAAPSKANPASALSL